MGGGGPSQEWESGFGKVLALPSSFEHRCLLRRSRRGVTPGRAGEKVKLFHFVTKPWDRLAGSYWPTEPRQPEMPGARYTGTLVVQGPPPALFLQPHFPSCSRCVSTLGTRPQLSQTPLPPRREMNPKEKGKRGAFALRWVCGSGDAGTCPHRGLPPLRPCVCSVGGAPRQDRNQAQNPEDLSSGLGSVPGLLRRLGP